MTKKIELKTRAVIFDMDGVITNTMPDHYRAWQIVLKEIGIRVSHHDVYSREGQRGMNSVFAILADHNKPCDRKIAQELLDKKEELFKNIVQIRFIPGSRSFLKYLYRQNFILALVTGTARHELHRILPDELYNLFSVIVTGTDVKIGKPDPEPFQLALKKLKIRPAQAVVVENAPFGIQSAKSAGIRCIAIETSLAREYLQGADYIFGSIPELRRRIVFSKPSSP